MASGPIEFKVAQQQKAIDWGDGSKWGEPIPRKVGEGATGMAYLNGVPVGVMTNIEYGDATVRLNTDGEGRVTTTAQQARDEIDRGFKQATIVPTKAEIKQKVGEVIAKLPPDLRQAIILRELEGLSYEEIAEAMDCPIGTVRSRIFRAREAIDAVVNPLMN